MADKRQLQSAPKRPRATAPASKRAATVSRPGPAQPLHHLATMQQTLGNQGVLGRLEAGLRINEVNDPAEREADRLAAAVIAASESAQTQRLSTAAAPGRTVQRKCAACEEEEETLRIQRKEMSPAHPAVAPPIVQQVISSPGQPLDRQTRAFMESRFGHDFGDVRVHTDSTAAQSARDVNALAYTVGRALVFGTGQYAPATTAGRRLLAHELAHVIQQARGGASTPSPLPGSQLEQTATQAAAAVTGGSTTVRVGGAAAPGLARQPRSLTESLNPNALSDADLKREIMLIRQWLLDNPGSSPEHDQLAATLAALENVVRQRLAPTPASGATASQGGTVTAGRPVASRAIRQPRSLKETLNPTTLSEAELQQEVTLIRQWLAANPSSSATGEQLASTLATLEDEVRKRNEKASTSTPAPELVAEFSEPGQATLTIPLSISYVSPAFNMGTSVGTEGKPGAVVAPGLFGTAGVSTLSFVDPLAVKGVPPGTFTRFVGPERAGEFFEVSRLGMTREFAPRLQTEPWTIELEQLWAKEGLKREDLLALSDRLRSRGFKALMDENDVVLKQVVRAHAERGLVRGSPLVSLTELSAEEALAGGLPKVATGRAYVVRAIVDPKDVGRVNEILGRTPGAGRMAQEMEIVVAQDLAGGTPRIVSITANPSGPLGGGLGAALRWTGRGLAVIGAATAAYEIATAEGPHRREIEGRAFGSFAGGTVLGALGVGFCIGAGIATGGVGLVLCGLLAGGAGMFGGQALGGAVGRQFD